ncbi:MAG: hypothetical protein U0520_05405 [Candidatus Saccharimonadales bacterium]
MMLVTSSFHYFSLTESSVFAADNPYTNIRPPGANEEKGIWIDRQTILLYNNAVDTDLENHIYRNTSTYALMDGQAVYTNGAKSCSTVTVNFGSDARNPRPGSATIKGCDGSSKAVTLEVSENAQIDGWYDSSTEKITMFRYLSRLSNCSKDATLGLLAGDEDSYNREGTFEKDKETGAPGGNGRDKYAINYGLGTGRGSTRVGISLKSTSGDYVYGYQLAYCPDGDGGMRGYGLEKTDPDDASKGEAGRRVYFVKDKTYQDILKDAKAVIEKFLTDKEKKTKLQEFFATAAGQAAIDACEASLRMTITTQQAIDASLLGEGVADPIRTCLNTQLADNEEYQAAIETSVSIDDTAPPSEGGEQDECKLGIPFIGDLVCKAVAMIFEGISSMFSAVIDFFGDTGEKFDRLGNNSDFKKSWDSIRNISNLIFLVAFLVVIFQYLTNINVVDAYFIKKFLPRVLIAAILVQASWWIVVEMNAATTDLGQSIRTIVLQGGGADVSMATGDGAVSQIAGGFLFGFAFLSPVGMVIVALIIGLILLLILLVCILILAMREVLLVLLAILAPLAFASFALPQLEGTLKKWLNTYVKLLMMYPIMQLLLTIGVIVGNALSAMGGLYELFGFIAFFLPFIVLPFTYKMGGNMMGKLVGGAKQLGRSAKGTYDKTPMGRNREAYKKLRSEDSARRRHGRAIDRAIEGHEAIGEGARGSRKALAMWQRRGLGRGEERENTIASFRAARDKEAVRRQVAEKDALNAQRTGYSLEIEKDVLRDQSEIMSNPLMSPESASKLGYSSNIDATGAQRKISASEARTLALDRLEDRAADLAGTDQQEYFAIMEELGRQKATGHIGRIQTRLAAQGVAGAQRWNAGVADNAVFSATTNLDKGFGQSIDSYNTIDEAQEGVADTRLSTFLGKNLQSRSTDQADAWKAAVHTTIQTGDTEKFYKIFDDLKAIEGNDNINSNLTISVEELTKYADMIGGNRGTDKGKSAYDPTRPRNKSDPEW